MSGCVRCGLWTCQRRVRRFNHFSINFIFDLLQSVLIDHAFFDQERAKTFYWIAFGVRGAFLGRAIKLFVVGQRMLIRANHFCLDHRRTSSLTAILNRSTHHFQRLDRISPVASLEIQ